MTAKSSSDELGTSLAGHLGIALRASRPVVRAPSTPPQKAAELLAEFFGLPAPDVKRPGPAGFDRALSLADRAAAGGAALTDDEREFLWSDPRFAATYAKRLERERAIAARRAP